MVRLHEEQSSSANVRRFYEEQASSRRSSAKRIQTSGSDDLYSGILEQNLREKQVAVLIIV